MSQNQLLFEINNRLPLELMIKIYSYCGPDKKKVLLKNIIKKCYYGLSKFTLYLSTLFFVSYIFLYLTYITIKKVE